MAAMRSTRSSASIARTARRSENWVIATDPAITVASAVSEMMSARLCPAT